MSNPFVPDRDPENYENLLATVVSTSGTGTILTTADGATRSKPVKRLATYTPTTGDRVLLMPVGDTYVILGKVVS